MLVRPGLNVGASQRLESTLLAFGTVYMYSSPSIQNDLAHTLTCLTIFVFC